MLPMLSVAGLLSTVTAGSAQEPSPTPQSDAERTAPGQGNARDLAQALLPSSDRNRLATEVENLIRKGDLSSAQLMILNAVDTDALAILVIDQLLDPKVVKQLSDQGLYNPAPSERQARVPVTAAAAATTSSTVPTSSPTPAPSPVPAGPPQAQAAPAPAAPAKPPSPSGPTPSVDSLVARAETLLKNRDVSAARLLLERAAESGNARAAFLLAETYDTRTLAQMGVAARMGDPAKAQELYARAAAGGIPQAAERLQSMK